MQDVLIHILQPNGTMLANDMALRKSSLVLEPVVKTVPGLTQALFIFAKVKFISGKTNKVLFQQSS